MGTRRFSSTKSSIPVREIIRGNLPGTVRSAGEPVQQLHLKKEKENYITKESFPRADQRPWKGRGGDRYEQEVEEPDQGGGEAGGEDR